MPSAEVPGVLRVRAGDPTESYLISKLQGSSGIVGVQMPFGGPYLPQATIDVIRQWISDGAVAAASTAASATTVSRESSRGAAFSVIVTMPADESAIAAPLVTIAIGLSQEPDAASLNRAMRLQNITAQPLDVAALVAQAPGNPSTVLLTPVAPLGAGVYRVTLHGGSGDSMTSVGGRDPR